MCTADELRHEGKLPNCPFTDAVYFLMFLTLSIAHL